MAGDNWQTKRLTVANLHLDEKNPRLGRETTVRAPREIIQYLFEHDDAAEIAESIATRGFFPNEPLLAVREDDRLVVVEGNRRLAALKALREPGLLDGAMKTRLERLSRRITDLQTIAIVPVTVAPSRRSTDRQIAGRHIGTPVRAWQAENRASFILEKIAEGYSNDDIRDALGFTLADIQKARQTRAIADMARSLKLSDEVKAKLNKPRAPLFTTIERVFDSSVGREFLKVEPNADHGIRGNTSKAEFLRGFTRLVNDVALGKQSSRTLNTSEDIRSYFASWDADERPKGKKGTFIPADIIVGKSVASPKRSVNQDPTPTKAKSLTKTVLPRDFKVRFGNDRLVDIARELKKLKRADYPNASAVLLRVFLELSILNYLERTGELDGIVKKLEKKNSGRPLPHGVPSMKSLSAEMVQIARQRLPKTAVTIEKALRYDQAAPFTISELHAFIHSADLPGERDILQFWLRTESLFRMMLENDVPSVKK
jgi:hypothetical protein